jgi:DNA-binding CsgD family transcriptional regulator
LYAAATGDLAWSEALAAIAYVHAADQVALFTPDLPIEDGGLWLSRALASETVRRVLNDSSESASRVVTESGRTSSLVVHDGNHPAIPATVFTLHRERAKPPFSEADREEIAVTCRHLARALTMWFRMKVALHGAQTMASALSAAVVMVDADSRVLWMNKAADDWLKQRRLAVTDQRLVAATGFSADLAQVARRAAAGISHVELALGHGASLEVAPVALPRPLGSAQPRADGALLLFRLHAIEAPSSLAARLGLTASEAELALALWNGMQLVDFAARRGVEITTVRTQLKSLLAKTGCRRQSDVVALVARTQPLLAEAAARVMGHLSYRRRDNAANDGHPSGR